jgi:hypothetical protein
MHLSSFLEIYSRIWSAALFPVTSPTPCFKVYADIVLLGGARGRGVESCWRPYSVRSFTLCMWPYSEPTKLLTHHKAII